MSGTDIFKQINNALLDLQQSTLQTFSEPLNRLCRFLNDESLSTYDSDLKTGADLDSFLKKSSGTHGSFVGTSQLIWPTDQKMVMGLKLLLIEKFGEDPNYAVDFAHTYYYVDNRLISGIHGMNRQLLIPFIRDYKEYVLAKGRVKLRLPSIFSNKIFIVHGHDGEARETIARFLERAGFEPIILHEQANKGRTIIEKVEANSDVGFAVVLLTPDDEGRAKDGTMESRARQNVLLELGYFIGKLGRARVCVLKKGAVEIPSDFAGVVWEEMDSGAWKQLLMRELAAAGYEVNWNKIMA